AVLGAVPEDLRTVLEDDEPTRWMAAPGLMRGLLVTAARSLAAFPAGRPSLRRLADETARVLAGLPAPGARHKCREVVTPGRATGSYHRDNDHLDAGTIVALHPNVFANANPQRG